MDNVLPAHETKHFDLLSYRYFSHTFELVQVSDGQMNGTALWLGAQCMSVFLADTLPSRKPAPPKPISTSRLQTVQATSLVTLTADTSPKFAQRLSTSRPRAIELGSGIGLTALALASLGWDVVATDVASVVNSVLRPNIQRSTRLFHERNGSIHTDHNSSGPGTVQVCELDWTVEPEAWTWDDPTCIASTRHEDRPACTVTSDTLYSASLVTPLLRTLHHLCPLSTSPACHMPTPESESDAAEGECAKRPSIAPTSKSPIIYLALENRDPGLVSSFLTEAKEEWGFSISQIPYRRVARAMERGGLNWSRSEWEGVEIWKLQIGSPGSRRQKRVVLTE